MTTSIITLYTEEFSPYSTISLRQSNYNFIKTHSGVEIDRINPNLILGINRGLGDYDIDLGLKLGSNTYIQTTDTYHENTNFTVFISFQHDSTKTCEITVVLLNHTPGIRLLMIRL